LPLRGSGTLGGLARVPTVEEASRNQERRSAAPVRFPLYPGLTRPLRNGAVLSDSDQTSHSTRHSAFGFVPGYDCSVPAALGFDILVPLSSEHRSFVTVSDA